MFYARCGVCGHANPDQSRFCNACGTSLWRMGICSGCGSFNALAASHCPQCGASMVKEKKESAKPAPAAFVGAAPGATQPAIDLDEFRRQLLVARDAHPPPSRAARRAESSLPLGASGQAATSATAEPLTAKADDVAAAASLAAHLAQQQARPRRIAPALLASGAVAFAIGGVGYLTHEAWSPQLARWAPFTAGWSESALSGVFDGPEAPVAPPASEQGTPLARVHPAVHPAVLDTADDAAEQPMSTPLEAPLAPPPATRTVRPEVAAAATPRRSAPEAPPIAAKAAAPCTPAVAALGLCDFDSLPRKE